MVIDVATSDTTRPDPRSGKLTFQCNLCGIINSVSMSQIGREKSSCAECHSTVRFRQIAWILSQHLFGRAMSMTEFPENKSVRGMGMTDPSGIATLLASKFDYTNFFFESDPHLDITDIPTSFIGQYDFIISSEVLEHVKPPVDRAFINMRRMLKPGGVLIFSVPYSPEGETREHFPNLHDFQIRQDDAGAYLVNRTSDGKIEVRRNLCFHGGVGSTLEMRQFGLSSIEKHLSNAGLIDITNWTTPYFEFGIYMSERWGFPFSAIAP